ncbi:MAG: hypothetical protein Q8927_04890 [Bacteroidota bacterium]|nr:hypothetical protein [Bacteroidota bacterium]MDP4215515.1 hypothetical protein [Bacteroidota bacterium]MDP4253076.1 hypothetical protein [Bacteroidota bacterium]MDP4259819.1 hypothetical protein [Bacteroidota bacterium]
METNSTQQEILLITGTSFANRGWSRKDEEDDPGRLTDKEQLEEACWNGMLREMLPEICRQPDSDEKLYVWKIREALSFLELDLGGFPTVKDQQHSIDPYCFMTIQSYS